MYKHFSSGGHKNPLRRLAAWGDVCVSRHGFYERYSSWLMNDRFDAGPWLCASHCGSKVPGWRSRRIVSGWGWAVAGRRLDTQFTLRSVVIDATVSYKRELKIITFWLKLIVYIFQPYALKLAVYRRQSAISSAVYFHTQHFHANRWAFNGQTLVEFDQGQTVRSRSNISHMNDNYILWLFSLDH